MWGLDPSAGEAEATNPMCLSAKANWARAAESRNPGRLSRSATNAGRADVAADAEKLDGRTAGELVTSTYAQQTSDVLLTGEYQSVLDTSVKTAGARIVANASVDLFGGNAVAQAECRLAIDSQTSSGFDQDIPLVGSNSDATLSFSFAAVVEAGTHAIDVACKEEGGNVEVIYATLTAIAVGE